MHSRVNTSLCHKTASPEKGWYIYILKCSDGSLYTGITVDLQRRLKEHNSGKGARYTRSRRPVSLVFHQETNGRSMASRLELHVKKLPRIKKQLIIEGSLRLDELLEGF